MEILNTQSFDDVFMQMSFKVEPCMLSHPHGWKMCPFVHPGEPVKRRHPSTHRGDMCNAVKKGQTCEAGDACPYAHNSHELWLHPSRYKTRICRSGAACARGICFFAHTQAELRQKGCTKQGVLSPSTPATATATLNTAAAAAAAAGVSGAAASPAAGLTGAACSPMLLDLSAAAMSCSSNSSSTTACSSSLAACGLAVASDCSSASSSCSNSSPCSLPALSTTAVPMALAPAVDLQLPYAAVPAAAAAATQMTFGEQLYTQQTQQCIAQLQQEVRQHLAQLEQSRLQEQMIAAALQQQQQQQLAGGAAAGYSSNAALQGVPALPATTIPALSAAVPALALSSGLSFPGLSTPGLSTPGLSTLGLNATGFISPGLRTPGLNTPGFGVSHLSGQSAQVAASSSAAAPQLAPAADARLLKGGSGGGISSSADSGMYWLLATQQLAMQQQQQQLTQAQELALRRTVDGSAGAPGM